MNPQVTNRALFVLAICGAAVSGYLTLAHLNYVDLGCTAVHGCEKVANHYTSRGFGIPFLKAIPTAEFGLGFYLAAAGLSMFRVVAAETAERLSRLQFLLACAGVAVSAYLTYLEAYVIHAWCQWCLASAAITILIFLTSVLEQRAFRARRAAPAPQGSQGELA